MDLLALVTKDEGQAISISDSGGLEQLVAVLDSEESTGKQKKKAAEVLKNMAKHNNADLASKMVALQISSKIAALRDVEDEEFANDALTLLQSITSTTGPEEAGLDEEDLKIISVAVENQGNKSVGKKGAELLDSLADVYKAEGADAITGKVAKAALNLKALDQFEEVQTDDGRTYYINRTDNTTSWEMPKAMAQATKQFQKLLI